MNRLLSSRAARPTPPRFPRSWPRRPLTRWPNRRPDRCTQTLSRGLVYVAETAGEAEFEKFFPRRVKMPGSCPPMVVDPDPTARVTRLADVSAHDLDSGDAAAARVRRGRPARINREQIVAAALGVPPAALTMQAVADVLGVDRKSVKYHIGDRETLLALMASAVFEAEFDRVPPPVDGDWRDVLRWYAYRARNAITQLGV